MNAEQSVELVGNITSTIAVVVASVVAVWGINAWRREFRGKRDIELAENALELFYRAERAIEAIRFPISSSDESQSRVPESNETPEQKEARDRAYVVFKRIQDHAEVFDQLYALRFRFMVRFGQEKAKPFDAMKHIISRTSVSAQSLAQMWADLLRRGESVSESTLKRVREHEEVIWSMGESDQIAADLKKIREEMEAICRPLIEGQISWFSHLWKRVFSGKAA